MRRQQPLLEHAQRRLGRGVRAQPAQRLRVVVEQLRLRIVARREADDELVEIEAGQHLARRQRQRLAIAAPPPVSCAASPRPDHDTSSGRNGISSEASFDFGPRAPRANKREAAVARGEHVEDAAGVAILAMVQHEGRLESDAFARLHGHVLTPCRAAPARARRRPSPRAP